MFFSPRFDFVEETLIADRQIFIFGFRCFRIVLTKSYEIEAHKCSNVISVYTFKTQASASTFLALCKIAWVLLQNHNPTSTGEQFGVFLMVGQRPGINSLKKLGRRVSTK